MSTRCTILAACLAAAIAGAAEPAWDLPQVVGTAQVPGSTDALGYPVKLKAVKSKAPLEELAKHIVGKMRAANLYVPELAAQPQLDGVVTITGLNVDERISYTAVLQPNPDSTVTVMLGETRLGERKVEATGVPLPPSAEGTLQSRSEGSLVTAFSTRAKKGEIQAFYAKELKAQGYTNKEADLFRREGEELRLLFKLHADGTLGVVLIQQGR